jgi:type VI secretion system protein ImpK
LETVPIIDTPLLKAATPLLCLIGSITYLVRYPDPGALRERVGREISLFEKRCRNGGVSMELLRPAHYALCVAIDDIILHTPWGAASTWKARSLTATFYRDSHNDKQFFDMLTQMRQKPDKFLPVIELMYLCLSLGFIGHCREPGHDPGGLERRRNEISALIVRCRGVPAGQPSRRWAGLAGAYHRLGAIPLRVSLTGAATVIGLVLAWVSHDLEARYQGVYASIAAMPPVQMPQIVRKAVTKPVSLPRDSPGHRVIAQLQDALTDDIGRQFVSVLTIASVPVLRINTRTMFEPGSASVRPAFVTFLERIGTILKGEAESVQIVGHLDDTTVRTSPFASNLQLSLARAQAVQTIMLRTYLDAGRISAEGRGDADPIASNATPEGREQNRRIEILLHLRV